MNAKTLTILVVFTVLFIFSVVSKLFFNDFQNGWVAYEKKDYKTARELWLPLAERGHVRAQFFLGFMHDMGFGVPEDDKKALKWYELAAEQGDSRALLFTGYIYDHGNGVRQDYQKAVKRYQLAAEQGYKQTRDNIYKLAKKNSPEALKILVNDAKNGSAEAQYILGEMYNKGQGVRQDYQKAVKWYQLARKQGNKQAQGKLKIYDLAKKNVSAALKILVNDAENGSAEAQYQLAEMYEVGQGVQQDYRKAVKWYQLAAGQGYKQAKDNIYKLAKKNSPEALKVLVNDAEKGSAEAQSELSMMYQFGLGVPQDDHESVKWHRFKAEREFAKVKNKVINLSRKNIPQALKALSNDAENGDVKAQMNLGLMYQLGIEVPKDEMKAYKWYRLAAEQGWEDAQFITGLMYARGQGVPQDDAEAMKWYRLASEQRIASEKASIYNLAKQNVPQALKILTGDAKNGIAEAQMNLGLMNQHGIGVPKDEEKAAKWYRLAAEQGWEDAQFITGLMYANGQGVPQDNKEAMKWYRLATEHRLVSEKASIYNLAKQNVPQALKILTVDAENGIAEAQYQLAGIYETGIGVPFDLVLAHMWYNLSALQGNENATDQIISLLEKKMSAQQIEQAQEIVKNWKPKE